MKRAKDVEVSIKRGDTGPEYSYTTVQVTIPTYSGGVMFEILVEDDIDNVGDFRVFIPWQEESTDDTMILANGTEAANGVVYLGGPEDDPGASCDKCGAKHTEEDIDGGRCGNCGTMLTAAPSHFDGLADAGIDVNKPLTREAQGFSPLDPPDADWDGSSPLA